MIPRKPYFWKFLWLGTGFVLIQFIAFNPDWVESYYSRGVFPYLSVTKRAILGKVPFSFGDFLYLSIIGWVILQSIHLLRGTKTIKNLWPVFIWNFGLIYLIFNVLWGLNYNRKSIDTTFGFQMHDPGKQELIKMADILIKKVNTYQTAALKNSDFDSVKNISAGAYESLANVDHSYKLPFYSLKASLFGKLGNYLGYSGYYNPFSAEGQVNMHVPSFILPYVACHEMAHQLGYAREDEANFVGFLAARQGNASARYAVYFSTFLYVNRALYHFDSIYAQKNILKLSPKVQEDLYAYKKYIRDYHTPLETFVDYLYDQFLRMNEQPLGTVTYSRVVIWMAGYFRKYGEL